MPKVSVIVPIYNVEKYLERCIDSIINQTLQDIEILLATDGPESCDEICEKYAQKDKRIKIVYHPGSYGKAFNKSLEIATGEYIGIVESDDWIDPTMYEKLYDAAFQEGADIAKSSFMFAYDNRKKNNPRIFCDKNTTYILTKKPTPLLFRQTIWSAIYSRKFLLTENIRICEERISYVDAPFQAEAFIKSNKIVGIKEPLYFYYQDNPEQSMQNAEKFATDGVKVKDFMLNLVPCKTIKSKKLVSAYIFHILRDLYVDYNKQKNITNKQLLWSNARKLINSHPQDFSHINSLYFSKKEWFFAKTLLRHGNCAEWEKIKNTLPESKIFDWDFINKHKIIKIMGFKIKIRLK